MHQPPRSTINLQHAVTIFTLVLALIAIIVASVAISGDIDYKAESIPADAISDPSKIFMKGPGASAVDEDTFNITAGGMTTKRETKYHWALQDGFPHVSAADLQMVWGSSAMGATNAMGIHHEGISFTNLPQENKHTSKHDGFVTVRANDGISTSYTIELPKDAPTAQGHVMHVGTLGPDGVHVLEWADKANATNGITVNTGVLNLVNTSNDLDDTVLINHSGGAAGGAAPNSIEISSDTGGIDILAKNAGAGNDIDIIATNSSVNIESTESQPDAIKLAASGPNSGIDISATGSLKINSAGAASNISHTAAAGVDFTVEMDAPVDNASLVLKSAGTADDALIINAPAGGIDMDAVKKIHITTSDTNDDAIKLNGGSVQILCGDTGNVTIGNRTLDTFMKVTDGNTISEQILVKNTVGEAAAAIMLTAVAGGIKLITNAANTHSLINLHSAASTSADSILLKSEYGGINLDCAGVLDISSSNNAVQAIKIKATTGGIAIDTSGAISIDSTSGNDSNLSTLGILKIESENPTLDAIQIHAHNTAGGVKIDSGSGGVAINGDTGKISLSSANSAANGVTGVPGAIEIKATTGGIDIQAAAGIDIQTTTGGIDINNLGTGGDIDIYSSLKSVHLRSGEAATNAIEIKATTGGIFMDAAGKIDIDCASTDDAAISLTATGGIDMDAAATKDVNIAGGQVVLVSKDDAAGAISLTTNKGSNETITITNTKGTTGDAIALTSTEGGINLSADEQLGVLMTGRLKQILTTHENISNPYTMTEVHVRNGLIIDNSATACAVTLPAFGDLSGILTRDNEAVICYYLNKGTDTATLNNNGQTALFDAGFNVIAAGTSKTLIFRRVSNTSIVVYVV